MMHNTLSTYTMLINEKHSQKSGFILRKYSNCQNVPILNHFVEKHKFLLVETRHGCGESEAEKKPFKEKSTQR